MPLSRQATRALSGLRNESRAVQSNGMAVSAMRILEYVKLLEEDLRRHVTEREVQTRQDDLVNKLQDEVEDLKQQLAECEQWTDE